MAIIVAMGAPLAVVAPSAGVPRVQPMGASAYEIVEIGAPQPMGMAGGAASNQAMGAPLAPAVQPPLPQGQVRKPKS